MDAASVFSAETMEVELDPEAFDHHHEEEESDYNDTDAYNAKMVPKNLIGFFEFHGTASSRRSGAQGSNKVLKCLTCGSKRTSSGSSTGNFVAHLKTHAEAYRRYLDMREKRKEDFATPSKSSSESSSQRTVNSTPNDSKRRRTVYESPSEKSRKITELLLQTIADEVLPLSVVDSSSFRNLLREMNEQYEPPSQRTLVELMGSKVEWYQAKLSEWLRDIASFTKLHLTVDSWNGRQKKNAVGVRVHFIDSEWRLHRLSLCVRHFNVKNPKENIQEQLHNLLQEYQLSTSDIGTCVSEDLTDMLKAFVNEENVFEDENNAASSCKDSDLEEERSVSDGLDAEEYEHPELHEFLRDFSTSNSHDPGLLRDHNSDDEDGDGQTRWVFGIKRLPCTVLALQQTLKDAFENSPQAEALNAVRQIFAFLKRYIKDMEWLQVLANPTSNNRRWNSDYHMLERFLKIYPHIQTILSEARKENGTKVPDLPRWDEAYYSELLGILDVFVEAANALQGDGVTASLVIPTISGISNFLLERKRLCEVYEHSRWITKLHHGLCTHFSEITMDDTWVLSTVLDPKFKLEVFKAAEKIRSEKPELIPLPSSTAVESLLCRCYREVSGVMENSSSCVQVTTNVEPTLKPAKRSIVYSLIAGNTERETSTTLPEELRLYLNAPCVDATELTTQLSFWRNQESLPTLRQLAQRFLSVPTTTSDAERLVSVATAVVRSHRSRLAPSDTENLIMIRELNAQQSTQNENTD